ncbi:DUF6531 domain-containing protein [Kitasatospora sp. NBC_01539]|uniref:DUF6531 domain-containing protein n=1 Tax=Kitasatospora sp. NBC_01539 TaxID=2903577 RepID=UPI003860263A
MSGEFRHDPLEVDTLAGRFGEHSEKMNDSGDRHLGRARRAQGRTRGRGALAQAAETGVDQLMEAVTKGQKALGKHLDDVGKGLKQTSANHRANEADVARSLGGITSGTPAPRTVPAAGSGTRSWASVAGGSGSGGGAPKPTPPKPAPPKPPADLRGNADGPGRTDIQSNRRNTRSDPVDIASGEVVLAQTDVTLPGVLPLVLSRTHVSSYRSGGWFGPSWASTLDQYLELDDEGVVFATEDGMLLVYPVPAHGQQVQPVQGPAWPLSWDGPDGGLRVTDPYSGTCWHFAPLPDGARPPTRRTGALPLPLAAVTDRAGNRIEILHGPRGVPTELRHSGGYRVGIDTAGPRITGLRLLPAEPPAPDPVAAGQAPADTVQGDAAQAAAVQPDTAGADAAPAEPDIVLVGFGYDGNGHLSAVTNSSGLAMGFTYDPAGRISSWTDRLGYRYRYLYDRAGRCVQTRGDGGHLDAVFAYDDVRRTTTMTDSLGHRTVFHLDEHGRTVRETAPHGAVALTEWDDRGRLLSRTDPLGGTTAFRYDAAGNLAVSILPDGTAGEAVRDEQHRITALTALDGAQWRYRYDEHGALAESTDPLGARTVYRNGPGGHARTVTDPLGRTTSVATDRAGLPVRTSDPTGAVVEVVRDHFGRPATMTDPLGAVTSYGWTVEGRPAWQVEPDGSRQEWGYDPEGNLVEHRDTSGAVTRFAYTAFGRLAARTAPDGTRYAFRYDTQLRLVEVARGDGARWTYRYDEVGDIVGETDFAGRSIAYTRDPAGRIVARTNGAGQTVEYRRDARGRTVELVADGRTTRYTYDAAGRVLTVSDGSSVLRHTYDAAGRPLTEECDGAVVTSQYDGTGRRVLRRTPSGTESRWSYGPDGLPQSLAGPDGTIAFEYDAAGREVRRTFGAAELTSTWDAADRLTALALASAGGPARRRGYHYRADGALVGITGPDGGDRTFELDAAARVTAVTGAGWTERYAYDSEGAVTRGEAPGPAVEDSDGARLLELGRLRTAGRTAYEYDGQGRLVRETRRLLSGGRQVREYRWDSHDQLVEVRVPDGTLWRYRYDPTGRRTGKVHLTADGTAVLAQTRFAWDGAQLAEEVHADASGTTVTSWDWSVGGQRPVAQTRRHLPAGALPQDEVDRRFHAIVTDLVGAPTELVGADGTVAWQARSTLWGAPAAGDPAVPGAADCPLRFPGQYADAETGLHYNVLRYYDPRTARYISPDPLGLEAGPDPYGYVPNPHAWSDPLGLDAGMVNLYHGTTGNGAQSIVDNGINPNFRPRPMDFGRGGFYVTNDRRQAERWAQRLGNDTNGGPAVMHFQVPRNELDALNSRRFGANEDQALGDFIRHNRGGGAMHDYDMVEGRMLMNMPALRNPNIPMTLRGHQMAFYTDRGASLMQNSYAGLV